MKIEQKELKNYLQLNNIDCKQPNQLIYYVKIIESFSKNINIISKKENNVMKNLLMPSLGFFRLFEYVNGHLLDIGSGGGFPAIPIKICAGDSLKLTMIEKNHKKCAFLKYTCLKLHLECNTLNMHIDDLVPSNLPQPTFITIRGVKIDTPIIQFLFSFKNTYIIHYISSYEKHVLPFPLLRSVVINNISLRCYTTKQVG